MRAGLTDEDLVGGCVGPDPGVFCRKLVSRFAFMYRLELKERMLTTVSQNGAPTISDEGKRSRKGCGGGSAGKAGNSGDGDLHYG